MGSRLRSHGEGLGCSCEEQGTTIVWPGGCRQPARVGRAERDGCAPRVLVCWQAGKKRSFEVLSGALPIPSPYREPGTRAANHAHILPSLPALLSQHPHHAFKRDTRAGTIPLAGVSFRLGDALKDPRPFPVPGRALLISWGLREAPELWSAHPSVAPAEAGGSQSSAAGLYSNCSPAASAAAAFGVEQSCCSAPRNATGGKKKKARRKSNPPAHPAGESLALPASS